MGSFRGLARVLVTVTAMALLAAGAMPAVQSSPDVPAVPAERATLDGMFGQVAVQVPAFGGMFVRDGVLNVYLSDPAQATVTVQAIEAIFGASYVPSGGVRFLRASYEFAQLSAWHNRMGSLFRIRGVVLTDIDEETNRLEVGVESAAYVGAVGASVAGLGIPRAAVNVVEREPIVPAATLRDRIRPIEGGIQIAFSMFLCTLGFNGVRAGVNGFVVNSHCTDVQGGVESTKHYQPNVASGNLIGTEIADPQYTIDKCMQNGILGRVCRYSDSAYDRREPGVTADQGFLARTDGINTGSLTIAGQFRIVSEGPSSVGATVNKVGRTTGWTQGQVTDTCANVGVFGTLIVQLCQDIVGAGVGGGDSGSPVFAITSGNDVQLRGILWGGNANGTIFVYSPIANIERTDELGPIATCAAGFTC